MLLTSAGLIDYSAVGHLIQDISRRSSSSSDDEDGTHAHQQRGGDRARISSCVILIEYFSETLSHTLLDSDFHIHHPPPISRGNHFRQIPEFRRVSVSITAPSSKTYYCWPPDASSSLSSIHIYVNTILRMRGKNGDPSE